MDDVDYHVEDNTMDDFFLSLRKDRVQGKPTFEDDPKIKITEKADHSKMAQRRVQAGNKMQMLGMILVTGEKLKVIPLFSYRITEETKSTRIPKEQLLE